MKQAICGSNQAIIAVHARRRCDQRVLSSSLPNVMTDGMVMTAAQVNLQIAAMRLYTYGLTKRTKRELVPKNDELGTCPWFLHRRKSKMMARR